MGGKSRKHANQMFHKREQLGTHTDALFSARRESEEDSTQKPQGRSAGLLLTEPQAPEQGIWLSGVVLCLLCLK